MLQIVIIVIFLIAFSVSMFIAVKEIIKNPLIAILVILMFIAFMFNSDNLINFIFTVVVDLFIVNKLEHKSLCKKAIIEKKLKKYNKNASISNKILNFNEDFFDMYNQTVILMWKILLYISINIPILIWELIAKFSGIEEPEGKVLDNLDNYYNNKLEICLFIAMIASILCLIFMFKVEKSQYYVISNLYRHRINHSKIDNHYNIFNGSDIFTSKDEKAFIGNYTKKEIEILNNGKAIY